MEKENKKTMSDLDILISKNQKEIDRLEKSIEKSKKIIKIIYIIAGILLFLCIIINLLQREWDTLIAWVCAFIWYFNCRQPYKE